MAKRTHIDHLLDRKGITKKQHAKLKAEDETRKREAEQAAATIAQAAIDKAMRPNVEHNRRPQGVRVDGQVGPHAKEEA